MGFSLNILKHSAIYSGANVLGKLVGFVMLPFYAHLFDTEGYGIIGMVDGSIGLLSILFGAASHNAVMRVYHSEDKGTESRSAVVSTSLWLIWCISILMAVVPIMFSGYLSELLLASSDHQKIIVLALLIFVLNMGSSGAENYLLIEQRSVIYSLVGLLRMILAVSLNIYLVIILKIGVIGVFVSSLLTAAVSCAILHWIVIANNGLAYNRQIGRKLLSTWGPLIPGEFFSYLGRLADRLFVRFLVSLEGVGILEVAYKFPPLIGNFISVPFLRAWRTKSFEIAHLQDAPVVIGKMFTNMLFLMVAAGLLLVVTIDELLVLMTPASFWGAAKITRILTVSTIIAAAHNYFIFGLLYANQPWRVSFIKTSMAALRVVLSGVFISLYGLDGAALSAIIVQTATLIWVFRASQHYYRVDVEYGRIAGMIGVAVTMAFMIEYAQQHDNIIGVQFIAAGLSEMIQVVGADGRILSALNEKTEVLASLLIEGFLASVFVLGIIVIRPGFVHSIMRRA